MKVHAVSALSYQRNVACHHIQITRRPVWPARVLKWFVSANGAGSNYFRSVTCSLAVTCTKLAMHMLV